MAAPRTPWLHTHTGYYCTKINGKQVYLDRDPVRAQRKLNRLLGAARAGADRAGDWAEATFDELADEFLADVQARRKPGTYADYKDSLERARPHLDPRLVVGDFKKIHLTKVEQELTRRGLGPTSLCKTLYAVTRVFAWAVENDLLARNPAAGYRRPVPRGRTRLLTPAEFRALLRHAEACFRRFLLALRWTGCRPGELRALTWECVDLEARLGVLPEHKTLTRQKQPRPRVIPLVGPLLGLLRWLHARRCDEGHVFRNGRGAPWTANALQSHMRRLCRRAGIAIKAGERIVLYSLRHAFATEALGTVSDKELAELLGHTTPRTLNRYIHLDPKRLLDIARRVQGG